jgi:hypothetical protein
MADKPPNPWEAPVETWNWNNATSANKAGKLVPMLGKRAIAYAILSRLFSISVANHDEKKILAMLGFVARQPWLDGVPRFEIKEVAPDICRMSLQVTVGEMTEVLERFEMKASLRVLHEWSSLQPQIIAPLTFENWNAQKKTLYLKAIERPRSLAPPEGHSARRDLFTRGSIPDIPVPKISTAEPSASSPPSSRGRTVHFAGAPAPRELTAELGFGEEERPTAKRAALQRDLESSQRITPVDELLPLVGSNPERSKTAFLPSDPAIVPAKPKLPLPATPRTQTRPALPTPAQPPSATPVPRPSAPRMPAAASPAKLAPPRPSAPKPPASPPSNPTKDDDLDKGWE